MTSISPLACTGSWAPAAPYRLNVNPSSLLLERASAAQALRGRDDQRLMLVALELDDSDAPSCALAKPPDCRTGRIARAGHARVRPDTSCS